MTLSREAILKAQDRRTEVVAVPEWGGEVIVGTMSGTERDAFEASIVTVDDKPSLKDMRARLAALCIVDEKGERVFSLEDVPALGRKSANALDRIARVAQRLNRLGDAELEELKGN